MSASAELETPLPASDMSAASFVAASLEVRGECWVRGDGVSMWPTIANGDRVLLRPLRARPRLGDVVLIRLGARLALHRVVRVSGTMLDTAGDANATGDGPRPVADLLARATLCRTADGRVVPLEPTIAYGPLAFGRWARLRLRLAAARLWRRAAASRR